MGHHHLRNLSHLEKKHLFMNKKCLSLYLSLSVSEHSTTFHSPVKKKKIQSLNSSLSGFSLSFLFLTKRMKKDEGKMAKNSSSLGVTRLKIHADYILCNLLSHVSLTASFSSLSTLSLSLTFSLSLSFSLIHTVHDVFLLLKTERVPCSQSLLILFLCSSFPLSPSPSLSLSFFLSPFRCYCLVPCNKLFLLVVILRISHSPS